MRIFSVGPVEFMKNQANIDEMSAYKGILLPHCPNIGLSCARCVDETEPIQKKHLYVNHC
jgi:hypothetical protein